jgi:hypothetical protein
MSGEYDIPGNRASGYGRYDLMLTPKAICKPGIVCEFKNMDVNETPEQTLERSMTRIEEKKMLTF